MSEISDKLYGTIDKIIFYVFDLGYKVDHEHYKSAREAEPDYEDNLDSFVQDICTEVEENETAIRLDEASKLAEKILRIQIKGSPAELDVATTIENHLMQLRREATK